MSGNKAKLGNILIARDTFRSICGASDLGGEGSKISVSAMLTKLFQEIYNLSGGAWDLTVTSMTPEQGANYGISDTEGKMFIVDRNFCPGANARKIHLNAMNRNQWDNSTRNVQLTGKVPKDMAAAAFVGGSGTTSGKNNAAVEVIKGQRVETLVNKNQIYNDLVDSRELIHDTGYNSETISAAKTNLKAYIEGYHSTKDKAEFRKDMYPLELSATLDGIAGIQFGNACATDLTPSRYTDESPGIVFTVTKTKHKLSPNDWTTDVESICRLEP